ncbi:MAG TPA: dihydroorotase family protein [Candidatus Bathyarchaeia archaeon]|nr:dihydroorotase family protein [Candidatus Bathyarchaeia archaeon]
MPLQKTRRRVYDHHESDNTLIVEDASVWTPQGLRRNDILIQGSRISKVAKRIESSAETRVKASGLLAIPGLVDAHVHLRDLELSRKEDFTTGTAAAAAGGFTTVLDMPNTMPATDSAERLREKQASATDKIHVNVGFHVAAVRSEQSINDIAEGGAFSLKLYMPRPISPLKMRSDPELLGIMHVSSRVGLPITVHAEDAERFLGNHADDFLQMARTRPPESEDKAVQHLLRLQEQSRCPVHFCHVTLASSLERINACKSEAVTSEVTPHHLLLSEKSLLPLRWKAWTVPPLRAEALRRGLYRATMRGQATLMASDHAPHLIKEKRVQPSESLPGVPGLETTLQLLLTQMNKGLFTLARIVEMLATSPCRVFGLRGKGKIEPGADADITLVDVKKKSKIDSTRFFSKAKYSPFDGIHTRGKVHSTIVRGNIVFEDDSIIRGPGSGSILKRNA